MSETIINGIDVSECAYFNSVTYEEPYCNIDQEHLYTCSSDENCYFKQLKRLQQELDIKEQMLDKFMIGSGETLKKLQEENEELKANKGRCAFKSLDNTFCDEAKIKIDKLELDKDCLNASLETARKYRGIAEADRDNYKQALEEIRSYCDEQNLKVDYTACYITNRIDEVLNDRD